MRNVLVTFALVLAACGGSSGLSTNNDGSSNTTKDMNVSSTDLATSSSTDLATAGTGNTDGGSSTVDAGAAGSVSCGTMTCTSGNSCCVTPNNGSPTYACMQTCGSGTIAASCDGPEDCSSGACCANIMLAGGSASGNAACQSATNDCSTGTLNISNMSLTTKLCHAASDCAGYQGSNPLGSGNTDYNNCCSYSGVSYMFCGPSFINGVDGIACSAN